MLRVLPLLLALMWQATAPISGAVERALALFKAGRYHECLAEIAPYVSQNPASATGHKILGMDQYMLGNATAALAEVQRATELNPSDPGAFYYLGRLYFSSDNPLKALAAFQTANALDPSSVRTHNQLGQTYEALNRLSEAEGEYKKAIELERIQPKKSEWPYYNLGLLCFKAGRREEAAQYLRTALDRRPQFPEAQVKLAQVLEAKNLVREARQLLEEAIQEEPHSSEAHYRLALLLSKEGKQAEAEQQFALFRKYRSP